MDSKIKRQLNTSHFFLQIKAALETLFQPVDLMYKKMQYLNYSRVHGVDGDGLPVDALGDLDRRHRGEAVGRVGHEELQAELGQTWKRK